MQPTFDMINDTLELTDIKDKWYFDEQYQVWCLEDVLYTMKATTPKFQRMSIFVPKAYMSAPGEICEDGEMDGYTAKTAPVIFENNSAGYMQMPQTYLGGPRDESLKYLQAGMVYVTCGSRGSESRDQNGNLCGKSPMNLIDLKMGIRFLRHNKGSLPGDFDRVISVGWSAGGAMSSLLALTGDHPDYDPYLEESGAFMDESDAVYAAQIYCPIVDLDHADLAYEWMFQADKQSEDSPAGPAEVMTPFKEAVSKKLMKAYIEYFNQLGVKNPETGEDLTFNEDGRSGSAYDYLMDKLDEAATKYLRKLDDGSLGVDFNAADYVAGNYTYVGPAPRPAGDDEQKDDKGMDDNMAHFAGPGVDVSAAPAEEETPAEPPTLGDLMARPPRGVPFTPGSEPPTAEFHGKDNSSWLSWDGSEAHIKDLDTYVLNHRGRMKPCTAFDTMTCDSGENRLFGEENDAKHYMHFDTYMPAIIEELKDQFPEEYDKYYDAFAESLNNPEQEKAKYLYNPLNYVGQRDKAKGAQYARIRVGSCDADTSFSVSMTLALLMAQNGYPVDYALVWDKPHSEADYEGEVVDWIKQITL